MQSLVVFAHPNTDSFNHQLLRAISLELTRRGHEVRVRDLYRVGFQPVLGAQDFEALARREVTADIRAEQELVTWAKQLIFIYPVWWYDRPAILKGWIDRVFSNGFAFRIANQMPVGLLQNKVAVVVQTAGTPEKMLRESGALDVMQKTMVDGTLKYCGISDVRIRTYCAVAQATDSEKQRLIDDATGLLLEGL